MTVLQLISSDRPQGQSELSIVPNPAEQDPESFESATTHPMLIGSQEIIFLAAGLCKQGYRVMDAVLTDRFFTRLEGDEIDELRHVLVALVNSVDPDGIEAFLKSELPGIYVESMRLLDASRNGSVSLRQSGIVITSPNVEPAELSRSVQTAAMWVAAS